MKRLKFHRAIVAIAIMLIGWLPSLAYDFEVNGICYNRIKDNNVEVAYSNLYSGNVIIPKTVTYNYNTYNVTEIGYSAFSGCKSLASIQIPNSVTTIEDNAFNNCIKLTSIEIPNSVTNIGNYVFSGCECLTSIIVQVGNAVYDSREGCNAIIKTATNTLVAGCKNSKIPNSITAIGSDAFYECTSLTNIEIPNSVISIESDAFYDCESLTSVVIGNSVTSIGSSAFSQCEKLGTPPNFRG